MRLFITNLREVRDCRSDNTSARKKRQQGPKFVKMLALDVDSPTFDDDLTYVFQRNIAKVRRENKKLFGNADGTLTKGQKKRRRRSAHRSRQP